jgi:hypothetical protein
MSRKHRKKRVTKFAPVAKQAKQKAPKKKYTGKFALGKAITKELDIEVRTFPVAWGFPLDELMFSNFFVTMMSYQFIMPWDPILTALSTYLPDARNEIHTMFVEAKNVNWLAMIDSDVLLDPTWLKRMISHDKPLVGGWYHHKVPSKKDGQPFYGTVVYDFLEEAKGANWYRRRDFPGKGLERVDGLGAGCLLMRRDLAEALGKRPYDMNAGGEDMTLCKKVYDLGFKIYVDWDMACPHVGVSYI